MTDLLTLTKTVHYHTKFYSIAFLSLAHQPPDKAYLHYLKYGSRSFKTTTAAPTYNDQLKTSTKRLALSSLHSHTHLQNSLSGKYHVGSHSVNCAPSNPGLRPSASAIIQQQHYQQQQQRALTQNDRNSNQLHLVQYAPPVSCPPITSITSTTPASYTEYMAKSMRNSWTHNAK